MKHTTLFFLFSLLIFACENKKQESQSKKQDSYKKKISVNKIRFENVYVYDYRFGKPDTTNGFLTEKLEFDSAGNAIKSTTFNKEDFMKQFDKIEEYKYDTKGNNIQTTSKNSKGEITSIAKNTFSENGLNTERLFYGPDGKLTSKVLYMHDNKSNITEQISYEGDGSLEYKIQYKYNDKNDEISSRRFDKTGKLIQKIEQISSNDSVQKYELYDSTNTIAWKSIIKINSKGNVVERIDTDMKSNQETRTEYKYDNNEFITEIIEIKSHGEPQSYKKFIREKFQ